MAYTRKMLPGYIPEKWLSSDGTPISCDEKIKVLNENLEELHTLCQDALEDAVLMGCDEQYVRDILQQLITTLAPSFKK